MKDLTAFQRDLLLIISGLNEPKGLDVNEELELVLRNRDPARTALS